MIPKQEEICMKTVDIHSKNKKFTAIAWALAALMLAVMIPLNLIFGRLDLNIDMTQNSMYTLTKTTTDYLDSLDQQGVVVDVYFLTPMEQLEGEVEVLALYQTLLAYDEYDCFNLIDIDPDTEPQALKDLNPDGFYNLSDGDFMFVYGDMVKRMPGKLMYTYAYETDEATGSQSVVSASFNAENYFTGAMKSVVEGVEPTVYFLEGHGEIPLSKMSRLQANLGNYNYGAKQLNLKNADAVPDDACILMVAGPTTDITDEEYEKISDFLDKGGNITLLMTPNDAELSYKNLTALMGEFCIGMEYNRIYETDSARHVSGNPYIFYSELQPPGDTADVDLTSALLEGNSLITYMPASRSFYSIFGSNYDTLNMDTLLKTYSGDPDLSGDATYTAVAEPYGGTFEDPETIVGQQLTLAMYSEDTMRDNKETPDIRESAKMVVFGSAEFLTDDAMKSDYYIQPVNLFLATITWMYNSDVDMNIDNKDKTFDSLKVNSEEAATGYIALFVAVPCAIALVGVIIWLRRKDA